VVEADDTAQWFEDVNYLLFEWEGEHADLPFSAELKRSAVLPKA
jgi:hypothetical protein